MHCAKGGSTDNRSTVSIKLIKVKKIANFHFNQIKKFQIVNHINFIHKYKHSRYVYLVCKKNVFTCLRHWAVISSYYQDSTVHLGSTCNHILDIVLSLIHIS